MRRITKMGMGALFLLGLGLGGWVYLRGQETKPDAASFRTAKVEKGDIMVTISATGTVEPEEVVDVGAQVAGQIVSFGTDSAGRPVDYGSLVEEGTVLARIDDSLYAAEVAQAEAQLQSARASLQKAEADLEQLKAKLQQAERDWKRAQRLGPSEALSQASYDSYQSAYEVAAANLAVGKAAVAQARAGVAQAEATLQRARRNLSYCTIRSPVKGVIIDRRVNIGQTVVASLNAPSLFLIAKDLRRMQVWVAVNEADIGRIRPGQPVSFTVDAFPGETFRGEVGKIRLNASMTQNVVTYTVEVLTDNSSGKLLPYLSANVSFHLEEKKGVLLVPNSALKWRPQPGQYSRADSSRESRRAGSDTGGKPVQVSGPNQGILWVVGDGSKLQPLRVLVGLSDGLRTEVQGENLKEGLEVVVGQQAAPRQAAGSVTPFTPQVTPGAGRGMR
ncbi:MAG: efflux RND transporter periplasmic adaptor subunit [bacterium]